MSDLEARREARRKARADREAQEKPTTNGAMEEDFSERLARRRREREARNVKISPENNDDVEEDDFERRRRERRERLNRDGDTSEDTSSYRSRRRRQQQDEDESPAPEAAPEVNNVQEETTHDEPEEEPEEAAAMDDDEAEAEALRLRQEREEAAREAKERMRREEEEEMARMEEQRAKKEEERKRKQREEEEREREEIERREKIAAEKKAKEEEERRKKEEEERIKREEEERRKNRRKGLGGLSPEKKQKLKQLIMDRALQELRAEEEENVAEKKRIIKERVPPLNIDGMNNREDLERIVRKLYQQYANLQEEKYDVELKIRKQDFEINELTIKVNDIKGKFIKPVLKKVSKTDAKLARFDRNKGGKESFRNQLKSTGQSKYALKEEDEKNPDWREGLQKHQEAES